MSGLTYGRTCCTGRRPAPISTSARTTAQRCATRPVAVRSTALPPPADSRCIGRPSANRWKRWTARRPRCPRRARMRRANGIGNGEFREADVFDLLAGYSSARLGLLDGGGPPAGLAQSRGSIPRRGARIQGDQPAGAAAAGAGEYSVTCSCSHHINEAMLLELVAEASLDANRTLRVLERRTQSQDHPIPLRCRRHCI